MVRLMHAHTVDTCPFLPHREGPGDKARALTDNGMCVMSGLVQFIIVPTYTHQAYLASPSMNTLHHSTTVNGSF